MIHAIYYAVSNNGSFSVCVNKQEMLGLCKSCSNYFYSRAYGIVLMSFKSASRGKGRKDHLRFEIVLSLFSANSYYTVLNI